MLDIEKDRRLDRYMTVVRDYLAYDKLYQQRWPNNQELSKKRHSALQRMKRRRALLLKDGITEQELEAAYLEAAVLVNTEPLTEK